MYRSAMLDPVPKAARGRTSAKFSGRTESIPMNGHDKLASAREIAMLYVIFLGSDYERREEKVLT